MSHPATPTDTTVVAALLRALADGPVTLEARDLEGLASAYWPLDGLVALNPAASPQRQAEGLVHALRSLDRPDLRVLPGGAS